MSGLLLPLRYPRLWLIGGVGVMALTLMVTLAPVGGALAAARIVGDKAAHFIAFTILMLWFCGVFRLRATPLVAVGLILFGAAIEWLQSFLPYRSAEFADLAFDLGGIAAGWALAVVGLRHWTAWLEDSLLARAG